MSIDVGDRIEVTSNILGVPPRYGEVLAKSGGTGLQVRWDDGSETVFVPAGNCRVVSHGEGRGAVTELGCRVEVKLIEANDECRATASVDTSRGRLHAEGIARRNPTDPQIPMIGEELALGRALESLAEQLITAANDHLSSPPSPQEHLVG